MIDHDQARKFWTSWLQTAVKNQDNRQGLADDALCRDLDVPVATPTPTAS